MDLQGTWWIWSCLFAAVTLCAAEKESVLITNETCWSEINHELIEHVSSSIKSPQQAARLLLTLRNLTEFLNNKQRECHIERPTSCPTPTVPENGGLGCVTVGHRYLCKPMCNHGFDFQFMRKSLLFNECSAQTNNKWNTQYIGGNNLAFCQEGALQIAGRPSAYFPKNQDCLTTKSHLEDTFIKGLIAELQTQGIEGEPGPACLICA